jgi:hypothetical protein
MGIASNLVFEFTLGGGKYDYGGNITIYHICHFDLIMGFTCLLRLFDDCEDSKILLRCWARPWAFFSDAILCMGRS